MKIGVVNMSWIKINKANFILLAVSLIISVLAAEVVLRAVVKVEREVEIISDDILGKKAGMRGSWDENGFRNRFVPDKADIVIMGDSQTQGVNAKMDEAWPQVLSQLSGKTVYQMAFIERGVPQHYYLLDQALAFDPSLVMVGFYLGNDLLDAYNLVYRYDFWQKWRLAGDKSEDLQIRDEEVRTMINYGVDKGSLSFYLIKLRQWLRSKSYFYTLLGDGTRQLRERLGLAETKAERQKRIENWIASHPEEGYLYPEAEIKTILSPSYRLQTVDLDNPQTQEGWRITRLMLAEMNRRVSNGTRKFIVVIIPTKELVYGTFMQNNNVAIPEMLANIIEKEKELREVVLQFCLEENIICIDTTPALAQALQNKIKIYPESLNGHPLPPGYKIIAEAVYNFLQTNNLLD